MSLAAERTVSFMECAVLEALEGVATPDGAQLMLAMALSAADLHRVPSEPAELSVFVDQSLREAVSWTLDEHAAEAVVLSLTPVVEMARSQVRPKQAASGSGPSQPPAAAAAALVDGDFALIATLGLERVAEVAAALGPRARVQHIADVYDLVAAVERERDHHPTLVLDCDDPSVDLHALSQVAPILPQVRIVLWGAVQFERESVERWYRCNDWVMCDAGLSALRSCFKELKAPAR